MNKSTTTRSDEFLAYFQHEAMCSHTRSLVLHGIEPGPQARDIIRDLRDVFVARTVGRATNQIPAITEETSSVDLLAITEVVLATTIAFLTPEELEERASMGFHAIKEEG